MVELLVVVAIISLLTAIAIPQYQKFLMRAKRTDAILTLSSVHKAQMSHFAAHEGFLQHCNLASLQLICFYGSSTGVPIATTMTIRTNQDMGLGPNRLYTRYGYQFYYLFKQQTASLGSPWTSYALSLQGDLDNEPAYTDEVLIHVNYFPNHPEGVPVISRNDISNN